VQNEVVGAEKAGVVAHRNRAAQIWVALLVVLGVALVLMFVYVTVLIALLGGGLPLVLSIVVWLVLLGTPAVLLRRARHSR
jgi:hypothetical protein